MPISPFYGCEGLASPPGEHVEVADKSKFRSSPGRNRPRFMTPRTVVNALSPDSPSMLATAYGLPPAYDSYSHTFSRAEEAATMRIKIFPSGATWPPTHRLLNSRAT